MIFANIFDSRDKRGPRCYESWRACTTFLNGLEMLCGREKIENEHQFQFFVRTFEDTNLEIWRVKNIFRDGYKDGTLNFSDFSDGRVVYLSRCLGHKVSESHFLKFPRLCVLYSLCILKGRWRDCEEFVMKDDLSIYLYSKYVLKNMMPEKFHTEIVLGTILHKSVPIQKYFSEIEGLQRKKLCYN